MNENDTICALSTPSGPGGIAVIRLSGPQSKEIFEKVYVSSSQAEERKLQYGHITDGREMIDEAMGVYFNAPRSYTGEDMVEIHCHGGNMPVSRVLRVLTKAGARPAEPGEFTKRAFLNGKMDLSRAEAVMSYISSASEAGAKVSVAHLKGALYDKILSMQDTLTNLLAQIEAIIEYPDEDLTSDIEKPVVQTVQSLKEEILTLCATYDEGRILREGYSVAIAGRPNVGKSSLLNYLIGREKAIVTDIPGTTRDVIEDFVTIQGIFVRFYDTAGIRATEDVVEKIGVNRSHEIIHAADLILLVIDVFEGVAKEDIELYEKYRNNNMLVCLNKTDLGNKDIDPHAVKCFGDKKILHVSALTGAGLDDLKETIYHEAIQDEKLLEGVVITTERHKNALFNAAKHLTEALDAYANGMMLDCLSIDIKAAWHDLGLITGLTVTEDIIDRIFSTFVWGNRLWNTLRENMTSLLWAQAMRAVKRLWLRRAFICIRFF